MNRGFKLLPGRIHFGERLNRFPNVLKSLRIRGLLQRVLLVAGSLFRHLLHLHLGRAHRLDPFFPFVIQLGNSSAFSTQIPRGGNHLLLNFKQLRPSFPRFPFSFLPLALPVLLFKSAHPPKQQVALNPPHTVLSKTILRPEKPTDRISNLEIKPLQGFMLAHLDLLPSLGSISQDKLRRLVLS